MRPRSARVRARSGRRARMSIGALARETWRDMTSGTAWIGIWALLTALLLGGGISLDAQVIAREARAAADYQAAFASVRVVESSQAIDGATCRALAELDGVKGAIAIRKATEAVTPAAMPSASLQTWEYTGDAGRVFDMTSHDPAASGNILAEQVASALGIAADDEIALKSGASTPVKGVYAWDETDGRRLELASDLHAGVSKSDLVAKIELHTAVIVVSAAILSAPILTGVILRVPEADRPALWANVGLLGLAGAAGLLLGALLVALALREKKLFDYFKTR